MARCRLKRNQSVPPVSLFSFLDILAGTIGILILIIAVFFLQLKEGRQIVQLIADASTVQNSVPSYIICNGDGKVEMHDQGESSSMSISDLRVAGLIERIRKSNGSQYLIIGVRPDGFNEFEALRQKAEAAGIKIGYEPLDEGWRIRAPGGKLL